VRPRNTPPAEDRPEVAFEAQDVAPARGASTADFVRASASEQCAAGFARHAAMT
jgi:hypothetical protein